MIVHWFDCVIAFFRFSEKHGTKYIYNNTTHQIKEEHYIGETDIKPSFVRVYQLTYDKMGNLILKALIAEELSGKVKNFKGNDIQIEEKREIEYYP